ncbi:Homeobox Protein Hox-D3 [Manis pentadactyla]|nr:Homeobox Protein Hox-D3 [Manis pentadactyla]
MVLTTRPNSPPKAASALDVKWSSASWSCSLASQPPRRSRASTGEDRWCASMNEDIGNISTIKMCTTCVLKCHQL